MGNMKGDRPHNPLVAGSSPACPTFSTHTSEQVFAHYTNVAKTSFYAIFTQSATTDQRNSKQYLFLPTDFSEIFPTYPFFRGNSGNSGNAISFHFIFSNLQLI